MATVPRVREVLDAFRAAGRAVFHVIREYRADGSDIERTRLHGFLETARYVVPGTPGCEIVKDLNQKLNVTCVATTHNVDTAFMIAHKLVLLKAADEENGDDWEGTKIIAQGPLREVAESDDEYVQQFLSRRAES